jgi:ribonucleoside-triphosphate reductase (thioredoxin)
MDKEKRILSDITVFNKYAKFLKDKGRRETWDEILDRNMEMHLRRFPQLTDDIHDAYTLIRNKEVLPSMRSLQFAGKPIELNPSRIFNCAYLPMERWQSFSEVMFLLLGGTGVGYSVQRHHIEQLPEIRKPDPNKSRRFLIGDSIEGWADAIKTLMKSYFFGGKTVRFVYDDIREKGALLVTSGGKAPGPEPLRLCIEKISSLLRGKKDGEKLTDREVHDINCHIADAVLAGGIRRAAMISLFSMDSDEMLSCKSGKWWELNPQRARANNSAVILRNLVQKDDFDSLWLRIESSGSGEPGMYFTNDRDWGTNPCCEIALRPYQFCNLVEIFAGNITSQEDFNNRARIASFIATLQASYTDFHYLNAKWKENTEKDALIGVSMTGIASMEVFKYSLEEAVEVVKEENARVAKIIGIRKAARTTCVKPAGTTSLVLGTSSGIHAWHDLFYLRRLRLGKNESLYKYLAEFHPSLLEDDVTDPANKAILTVPQRAPEGSVTREESALHLLERVKEVSLRWIKNGHLKGMNSHNVSATINIRPHEWNEVREWMWENRDYYNGLSVMPFDGGSYKQTPFESIPEDLYIALSKDLDDVDITNVREDGDYTDLRGEVACAGGSCEIR